MDNSWIGESNETVLLEFVLVGGRGARFDLILKLEVLEYNFIIIECFIK